MAGYADSAANKQATEIIREFGGRIDVLETGLNTFSTQLATVDSKMERQHSEILQAVKSNSKGSKGCYGCIECCIPALPGADLGSQRRFHWTLSVCCNANRCTLLSWILTNAQVLSRLRASKLGMASRFAVIWANLLFR